MCYQTSKSPCTNLYRLRHKRLQHTALTTYAKPPDGQVDGIVADRSSGLATEDLVELLGDTNESGSPWQLLDTASTRVSAC